MTNCDGVAQVDIDRIHMRRIANVVPLAASFSRAEQRLAAASRELEALRRTILQLRRRRVGESHVSIASIARHP